MSKPKKQWMSFYQAHQWMKENQNRLNITSCLDYKNAYKEGKIPHLIPSNPNIEYANRGWKGMPHFLGLEILQYRSFEEAKKWAHEQTERGQLFRSKCWAQIRAIY